MPWVYYRLYRNYFQNVKFRFIPLNFPPAGFYICQNYIAK
jgi:phospholipid N-methyltransferase